MKISAERKDFLYKGYAIFDDFLSPAEVNKILDSIRLYQERDGDMLQVERRDLIATQVFKTIVGEDCEANIALLSDLWRRRILALSTELAGIDLTPINDAAIGLNLNITERSGQISFHYDRNEVTGVLYLQGCTGGELECYPHYRVLLPNRYKWYVKPFQRFFDLVWRTPLALRLVRGRREVIEAKPGRLVMMRGWLALHRVRPVEPGTNRIAGVFCYDKPEVKWEEWNSADNYVVQARRKEESAKTGR
ncbi:2OG-Fe(II) oxygenase [Mycobacterium sp. TY814]|uniref:2OG-Fe(II) oxygenase n=1 Tax=unclassified Mycobacterium TaxID=2642494 RepID=UPI00274268E9|nr:2OG-Fe(II) oxygenase [Mycobacterium sp. TY814]MDP7720889.1 2OG-Fe(II) oxygenase [Mycobacterium sp. TY814]